MDKQQSRARQVVVTGLGTVSPLGHSWPETWKGLIEGRGGVDRITLFDADTLPVDIAAEVKDWDPSCLGRRDVRHLDRSVQFAIAAAREAIHQAGVETDVPMAHRFGVVLASATGGLGLIQEQMQLLQEGGYRKLSAHFLPNMLVDSAAAHLAMEFGAQGPNLAVVSACATGSNAIGEAADVIRRGDADLMLAGGTEAPITPLFMAGFCAMRALATVRDETPARVCKPFDRRRRGLVVGEGAAVLVLEAAEHARARGVAPLAELVGYGTSCDAYHLAAPDPSAAGMTRAMRQALCSARMQPADIDYVSAHGTGTVLNDRLETAAIKASLGERAAKIPISSVKAAIGHPMGASGALEAVLCVQILCDGVVPPTLNLEDPDPDCDLDYVPQTARRAGVSAALSNSFGMGGHNATLVLQRSA